MSEKIVYCRACGKDYDDHTYIDAKDIEILRSQGCSVTLCDEESVELEEVFDITVDLRHLGICWAYVLSPDGTPLSTKEAFARCKAPADPCDSDFMEDISS